MKNLRKKSFLACGFVLFAIFSLSFTVFAEADDPGYEAVDISAGEIEEEDASVSAKTVEGVVSALSPGFIAVVYKTEEDDTVEYEIPFTVTESVKILRKNSIDELSLGDTVKVTYLERSRVGKKVKAHGDDELEKQILGRDLEEISFVKTVSSELMASESSDVSKRYRESQEYVHGLTVKGRAIDFLDMDEPGDQGKGKGQKGKP